MITRQVRLAGWSALAALAFLCAAPAQAKAPSQGAATGSVTYTKHIAPILWKNCAGCHRAGEVGPFPLLSYEDASKRADSRLSPKAGFWILSAPTTRAQPERIASSVMDVGAGALTGAGIAAADFAAGTGAGAAGTRLWAGVGARAGAAAGTGAGAGRYAGAAASTLARAGG